MRRLTRRGGVLAAAGLAAGLILAGPGAASATAGCPAWDGTPPASPSGRSGGNDILSGTAVVSSCFVWAAGITESASGADHTLAERWTGGGNWAVMPTPTPAGARTINMGAVVADSAADAWLPGSYVDDSTGTDHGLLLRWDGSSWAQVALPVSTAHLGAVAAVSPSDVWVTGTGPDGAVLLLHYDGSGWIQWPVPAITPGGTFQRISLWGMSATSARDVWAVGEFTLGFSSRDIPLTLHWDGSAWSQVPAPDATPPDDDLGTTLRSVSAISPADAWAVGGSDEDASTVIMRWDGHTWTVVPSPDPAAVSGGDNLNYFTGVAAVSASSAWAVGGYGSEHSGVTLADHNLVAHWDGRNWTQVPVFSPGKVENVLKAVAASPAGFAWAAGIASDQFFSSQRTAVTVTGAVPNVVGDSQAAATDAMDSAGLNTRVTTVTTAGGGCGPAANGTIIATTPAAGTFTAPPVTMTFCDFPPVVTVPSVVGLADNQAQGTLTDAGLTVGTITLSGNCSFDPGTVLRQSPAPGTTVSRGTAVNLTEATPPKPHGCPQ